MDLPSRSSEPPYPVAPELLPEAPRLVEFTTVARLHRGVALAAFLLLPNLILYYGDAAVVQPYRDLEAQGRTTDEVNAAPEEPKVEVWQYAVPTEEQRRNGINVIPPAQRPRVVLRYGDARDLLVAGLLDGGTELAQHPMVIDVPVEKGHVVTFSSNPIWRGETQGSYCLVFNTLLNFDNLNVGRKVDEK